MEIDLEMSSGECDDDQRINEGLEFESKEEAFEFYKGYAKFIGFNTIIKASRRSRMSGKFIDAKFVCTRYGTKKTDEAEEEEDINIPQARKRGRRTNLSSSKTDCKACLHVKKRQDGRWVIRALVKEHNHETFPSGQTTSIRESCGRGKEMKSSRKFQALEGGDVERLLSFFTDMQAENPFFFYAVDQTLRSVFWVDAKGRLDYACFSDVVSIDTTFVKNEYKLPLVAFIGVNHHGQWLLLGCGLLLDDESTKSGFVWLFKSWLKAMNGRQPRVILTKHDQTLKEAVSEALPASRHCFNMYDTLGQMSEKVGQGFVDEINEAIYGSCKGDEFEERWCEVVDRFGVRDNDWLRSLYEDREHWVPVYMQDVSLAGMCSADSVLDKYIQRKTTLRAFLDQYKRMVQERVEEEEKAEIETLCKQPGLKSPSPFGKQMAELYTREMFKRFQVEVLGGVACHPKIESDEGNNKKMTFRVQDYEQNRAFVVVWSSESSEVVCSCRLFEFKGFLCRHAMIVLQMSGELSVPSRYVLKRWRKDARRREAVESDLMCGDLTKAQRYKDLCLRSLKLSEEASLSEESYNAVMNVLNEAFRKCEITSNVIHIVEESDSDVAHEEHNNNNSFNENVADTGQEHSLHEAWKETALQEQRHRYSILDDYLSAQQMSHEMGQISMMASNRNGYSTSHQNIHSLGQSITQQRLYETDQLSFRPDQVMYERLQDMTSFRHHPQQHCESSKHQQSNKNVSL
ncbi:protein FAR1-RELATED SEQUENCE 1 isoform X2 [Brassica rapa]|uniref:protein FAR1-RELATED SEQUENCE 1 isoform X2 n=1 Tax=Brassica campestris TaxID=3711 RepID=UPI0004F1A122|nr:protein FAR1-RELATED SEQUENCE 1 isoform X2 [Brassica rapa]